MTKISRSGRSCGDRKCRNYGVLLLSVVFLLWPAHVFALGFLIPNQDAAAIARGNAFVATADNPSAIFYNPAGISQLEGQNVEVGVLNYMGINVHYDSPSGTSSNSKFQVLPVPQVYYTFSPTNLPLSFGVGLYAPFGLGVQWPQNSGFRSIAIDSKLQYFTLNPVVAWKIRPGLSLAAGPTFNYSHVEFNRGIASPTDNFEFDGNGYAFGFTAGLLWQPVSEWSFGVSYRSATTINYNGNSTYHYPGLGSFAADTSASLPFPQIVSGGISYRPTSHWNIEADVDWINWNTLNSVTFQGTKNLPLGGANLVLPFFWHNSMQYKFGATRYFDNGWFASAGYFFSGDTTSSTYFNPAVPDTELNVGSLGFGHDGEHWHWAVAGQIIAGPQRTIAQDAGNTNPYTSETAAGKYQLIVPAVTVSLSYHF